MFSHVLTREIHVVVFFLYGVQTIFTQKLLLNFTYNEKETANNIKLNMK